MSMTRDDVVRIIREARAGCACPDLRGLDMRDADLSGLDLYGAYLYGADLYGAYLYGADLRGAYLRRANLRRANLRGANLRGANLSDALWSGLRIDNLPSGQLTLTPTPTGWHLDVGCWNGTVFGLATLALSDDETDWPEARGEQIAHRRPLLLAAVALCRAHIDANPTIIDDLAKRWSVKEN